MNFLNWLSDKSQAGSSLMGLLMILTIGAWLVFDFFPAFVHHFSKKEFVIKEYFRNAPLNFALAVVAGAWLLSGIFMTMALSCSDAHRSDPRNACQNMPSAYVIEREGYLRSLLHYAGSILAFLVLTAFLVGMAYLLYWLCKQAVRRMLSPAWRYIRSFKLKVG